MKKACEYIKNKVGGSGSIKVPAQSKSTTKVFLLSSHLEETDNDSAFFSSSSERD